MHTSLALHSVDNREWALTRFWRDRGTVLFAVAPRVGKPRVANHSALASPGASLTTTIGLSIGGAPAFEAYYIWTRGVWYSVLLVTSVMKIGSERGNE